MENKKSVIITGAAGGIGRATVLKFAANHYNITLVDQHQPELEALSSLIAAEYNVTSIVCAGDLGTMTFLKLVIEQSLAAWGGIQALINNAAWRTIETMRTMDITTWEKTLKVCLTAPAFLSKFAAEIMEQQDNGGVIINISSVMSERAAGYSPAYISAKGALESLTRELAVTYGRKGIRVLSVSPGFVDTAMSRDYRDEKGVNASDNIGDNLINAIPLARAGGPEEIASAIFWLASSEASYITGTNLLVDGGLRHNFNDYSMKKLQFPEQF